MQARFGGSPLNRHLQVATGYSWFKTCIDHRSRLGLDDIPRLGFAPVGNRHACPIGVIRMNLDAEYPLAIQILKKKRETARWALRPDRGP
jgi:hypothetical protein